MLFTVLDISDAFSQLMLKRSYIDLSTTAISVTGTRPVISKKPAEKGAPVSTAKSTIKASAKFSPPSFNGKKFFPNKRVVSIGKSEEVKKTSAATKFSFPPFGGKKVLSNKSVPLSKNSSTKSVTPVKTSATKISLSSPGGRKKVSNDKKPSTTNIDLKKVASPSKTIVLNETPSAPKDKVTKMSNKTSSVPIFYLPKLSNPNSKCVEVIRTPRKNGSFEVKMVSKGGSLPKWYSRY